MAKETSTIIRFRIEGRNVTVYRETVTIETFGTKPLDADTRMPEDLEAYRKNLETYFREPVEYVAIPGTAGDATTERK